MIINPYHIVKERLKNKEISIDRKPYSSKCRLRYGNSYPLKFHINRCHCNQNCAICIYEVHNEKELSKYLKTIGKRKYHKTFIFTKEEIKTLEIKENKSGPCCIKTFPNKLCTVQAANVCKNRVCYFCFYNYKNKANVIKEIKRISNSKE